MVEIVKDTRQRFVRPKNSGDIILDAHGPSAVSEEALPVIGGFKDYTGSGGVPTKQQMFFPAPNKLWGTDASLEGAKDFDRDTFGNIKQNFRLRRKKIYIE